MTLQEQALGEVVGLLNAAGTPYMIVGGLANIVWGEPRATLDIDVTVWVEDAQVASFVNRASHRFKILVDDPREFIARTRVLPAESRTGVRVDFIFGLLPFEREAIDRAMEMPLAGSRVRVCTAEDLILMKIVSDRDRDAADARAIVQRRLSQLDLAYLKPRVEELAKLLDRPDIRARWDNWTRG